MENFNFWQIEPLPINPRVFWKPSRVWERFIFFLIFPTSRVLDEPRPWTRRGIIDYVWRSSPWTWRFGFRCCFGVSACWVHLTADFCWPATGNCCSATNPNFACCSTGNGAAPAGTLHSHNARTAPIRLSAGRKKIKKNK